MIRRVVAVAGMTAGSLALGLGLAPAATSLPTFAAPGQATIHPGVQMVTDGAQCTANFVFAEGENVYLGYAAHCAGQGEQTDLDGCSVGTYAIGTPVEIQGATRPGKLAYSSWGTMQAVDEQDGPSCAHNDFAFVLVDPADHGRVSPTVPHWGGPIGIAPSQLPAGTGLRAYGNSGLRLGLTLLSPMGGLSTGNQGGGWAHSAYTLLPGIPGDSGMPLITTDGRAVGVLSSISILPNTGSLNFTDVGLALHYARTHGFPGLQLVNGGPVNLAQLPLDL